MAKNKRIVLEQMRLIRSAKVVCELISLCILIDQFQMEQDQSRLFYKKLDAATAGCTWTKQAFENAQKEFLDVAKRSKFTIAIRPGSTGYDNETDMMILYSEATCLYKALRILRTDYKATHAQMDFFGDRYTDFCHRYSEGEQANLNLLAEEVSREIGYDILKGVEL